MDSQNKDRWLVVVNPNAGIGKCGRDWNEISRLLDKYGFNYMTVFTKAPLHAIDIVKENIGKGFRKIISVGGDGTMNEVVNGIFNQNYVKTTDITVAMIAVGTGNDWVKTFNIPANYEKAIIVIKNNNEIIQDVGFLTYQNSEGQKERYFINVAGLGFDGLVAQKTNYDKKRGKGNPLLYLKNLFTSLYSYKSANTTIFIDNNKQIKTKTFSIGIGIGKYNGGGMLQVPDARPDSGEFNMTLIKDMSRWSVIASLKKLYNGKIGKHKKVETFEAKTIKIESKPSILLEADGESLGNSPVEMKIIPKSVKAIINYL